MTEKYETTLSVNGGPEIPFDPEVMIAHLNKRTTPGPGHNAPLAADRLRSLVERIERMRAEQKERGEDVKEIYAEAKGAGYDVKILRQLVRIREQDPEKVAEAEEILATYRHALGMA